MAETEKSPLGATPPPATAPPTMVVNNDPSAKLTPTPCPPTADAKAKATVAGGPTTTTSSSSSTASPPSTLWAHVKASLFSPWLVTALHNRRQWKNFVRTLIALFVMCVLMVDHKSLDALGVATYFGLIATCILTPSMPLCLYVFAFITLGMGMCIGWAWGVAAWAAGLDVRSQSRLQAQMAAVQATYNPNVPAQAQYTASIFAGKFLDPGTSAVFGIFLFIGTYALAWLRASKPKLALIAIFGTIILDLMATLGPLFPVAQYTLAKQLMVPASAALAVGICCTILFFPQTLNHLVMGGLVGGCLTPIQALLKLQDDVLKTDPDDHKSWGALADKAGNLRRAFVTASGGLAASARMLHLEISHGRISGGQLDALLGESRDLGARAFGLGSFVMMVEKRHQALKRYREKPLPHSTSKAHEAAMASVNAEKNSGRSLRDLMPELESSTAELRQAAQDALAGAIEFLSAVNDTRWKAWPKDMPTTADRDAQRQKLADVLAEYRSSKYFAILRRYKDMFDTDGNLLPAPERELSASVRGLFLCFIFTSALITYVHTLGDLLEFVRLVDVSCPKNKFQFPGKFVQTVVENANDSTGGDNEYDLTVNDPLVDNADTDRTRIGRFQDDDLKSNVTKDKKKKKRTWPKDPDARSPTNVFQRFGRAMESLGHGLSGPNGMYALRYGLVSIALWIPAICPTSAKFYYESRGIWALIMAQTGLGFVTGEAVYGIISRVAATIIGAVAGMVIWYIGAQKGSGNQYGIVAATVIGTAPFLFCRLACPPTVMPFWILASVTVVFIVGVSWVDENTVQTANQGDGYTLAARRSLLVIIGVAAGMIAVLFPRPVGAKMLVREGICKNIAALGELYGLEITAFERSRDDPDEIDVDERKVRYRERFLKIFDRFGLIEKYIGFASMELSTKGEWPKDDYKELLHIQGRMLVSSASLSSAYSQLNAVWIRRLTDQVDVLNPAFTADCFSLFTLLRHSLRYKVPLPPLIPLFERLAGYAAWKRTKRVASHLASRSRLNVSWASAGGTPKGSSLNVNQVRPDTPAGVSEAADSFADDDEYDDEDQTMLTSDKALWESFNGIITWQACHDEQFAIFAVALISLMHMVSELNHMHSAILDLAGERELEGFELAQQRYAAQDKC